MIGVLSGPLNPKRQSQALLLVGAEVANQDFL